MAHCRTQIREAVMGTISGLSQFDTVYNFHSGVFPENQHIANVITVDEYVSYDIGCMGDIQEQERELRLLVELRTDISNETVDNLDILSDYIEEAILTSTAIDALAYDIELENLTFEYSRDGDKQLGKSIMTFRLTYQTDGLDPSTIL